MPDNDLPPSVAWATFGSLVWSHVLAPCRQDVAEALHDLEAAVKAGERPQASDVREARRALDEARALVEEQYADLADDVDTWGSGAGRTVPHGVLAEQLEDHGYTVRRPSEEPVVDLADVNGGGEP